MWLILVTFRARSVKEKVRSRALDIVIKKTELQSMASFL